MGKSALGGLLIAILLVGFLVGIAFQRARGAWSDWNAAKAKATGARHITFVNVRHAGRWFLGLGILIVIAIAVFAR